MRIGKRAFLGNSGMAAPGHRVPRDGLVAVLSSAPLKAKPGSSWLGSPAVRLRRQSAEGDESRTYAPARPAAHRAGAVGAGPDRPGVRHVRNRTRRAVRARGHARRHRAALGRSCCPGRSCSSTSVRRGRRLVAAKWIIVGPIRAGEQPLWSSFVWRTEVSDTFTEMVAAPWFARSAAGTPALAVWLRSLGAQIGRGVWCDSYWLPEPDLVTLGDGSTVNRGCVVQTHLFHDRIMSMDTVELEAGATLGPHSVILPAATIGAHATVGPASLVMRGETVPVGSRWSGNPIGPWRAVKVRAYQSTS